MNIEEIRAGLEEARRISTNYPDEGLAKTRVLLSLCRQIKNKDLELIALANMANHFHDLNDWQKGLTYASLTLRLAKEVNNDETIANAYLTQAALQFRTLKLKESLVSLLEAGEILNQSENSILQVRSLATYRVGTYMGLLDNLDVAVTTLPKAIDYYLEYDAESYGRMVYSTLSLYLAWLAMQPNSPESIIEKAEENLTISKNYPMDYQKADGGFLYYTAEAEVNLVRKNFAHADSCYSFALTGFSNPSHAANLHAICARSAHCRTMLGDAEGAISRLEELKGHVDAPATRLHLPQSLRIGMSVSDKLNRPEDYQYFSRLYRPAHQRLKKAKLEARSQIISLRYFAERIS